MTSTRSTWAMTMAGLLAGLCPLAVSAAPLALDVTPPVLKRFSVSGAVDARIEGSGFTAELALSDDLSGVIYYAVELKGPSGHTVSRGIPLGSPKKYVNAQVDVGRHPLSLPSFNRFSEPGTWTVDVVYAYDAAGNIAFFYGAELAALGNLDVVVTNPAGFDATPPELKSGVINTASVSLSKPPRGTPGVPYYPPWAHADLQIKDLGNGQVAGVWAARLDFCKLSGPKFCGSHTFSLEGVVESPGPGTVQLRVGAPVPADSPPGEYQLVGLFLIDLAENQITLTGPPLGGGTDFSKYFAGTSIAVKP